MVFTGQFSYNHWRRISYLQNNRDETNIACKILFHNTEFSLRHPCFNHYSFSGKKQINYVQVRKPYRSFFYRHTDGGTVFHSVFLPQRTGNWFGIYIHVFCRKFISTCLFELWCNDNFISRRIIKRYFI